MKDFNIKITDFNLNYYSDEEKTRFYKIFQILEEVWQDSSQVLISKCKDLSTVKPSIHSKGYHTWDHTKSVVEFCYNLALPLHQALPNRHTAIEVLVLLISAMLHDYVQEGDICLTTRDYETVQNGRVITKQTKIPSFKRETGNNEFASANSGVEIMKKYNKQYNSKIFKPENINSLLNLIQATEPDFGRVAVLEGQKLIEYVSVIQPKLINPIIVIRWILCVSDLGTVAFAPQDLMQDAYKLIREEIWEANLIKILKKEISPAQVEYENQCIISSLICKFILFQVSFVKAQKQRTQNYLAMFDQQTQEILRPHFETYQQSLGLDTPIPFSNFDYALELANKEVEIVQKLHTKIIHSDPLAFIELIKRAGFLD